MNIRRLSRRSSLALLASSLAALSIASAAPGASIHSGPPAIDRYLIASRAREIDLARSAAPPSISAHASVMVLGKHGYVTAVKGTNGFVCLVVRSWDHNASARSTRFWNPAFVAPSCFNAAGAESVLPRYLARTKWVLAGTSQKGIRERDESAWAAGRFAKPKLGALCYMMSKDGTFNKGGPWRPHVMFYVARGQPSSWGANSASGPIFAHAGAHMTTFFVLVPFWSDGTPAPHE
jgi:hypothetical protein